MTAETTEISVQPFLPDDAFPLLGRLALVTVGAALLVAALALWLAPEASVAGDLLVMKLGLSTLLGLVGLCALVGGWGRRAKPFRGA